MKTKARAERRAERRKRTSAALMADTAMPTAERLERAGGAFEIGGDKRTGRVVRMLDAPIEKLFAEHHLKDLDYAALCLLRTHWTLGQLSGNPQSIDYNRITHAWNNANQSERELFHREMFEIGWICLEQIERQVMGAIVLNEIALTEAGSMLGYRSPYRARMAVLEILQKGASKLVRVWNL